MHLVKVRAHSENIRKTYSETEGTSKENDLSSRSENESGESQNLIGLVWGLLLGSLVGLTCFIAEIVTVSVINRFGCGFTDR